MKKLFLIVAALFVAVSFSACSDDDEKDGNINSELIVGKWQLVREVGYSSKDGVKYDEVDDTYTADNQFLVFNADGTALNIHDGNQYMFYYKIESNIYSDRENSNDSWENDSDHPSETTIKKLTESELVMNDHREYTEQGSKYIDSYTDYYIRK